MTPRLLSVKEAAEYCGVSAWTIRRNCPIVRIGTQVLIDREDLDMLIASRKHGEHLQAGSHLLGEVLHPGSLHPGELAQPEGERSKAPAGNPRRRQGERQAFAARWKHTIFRTHR